MTEQWIVIDDPPCRACGRDTLTATSVFGTHETHFCIGADCGYAWSVEPQATEVPSARRDQPR